jgi:methylenetetrahydrofolate reductase (NADPH)
LRPFSHLQQVLESRTFAVTSECGPPKGADPSSLVRKASLLKGYVDAVNVTDNQTAVVRLCSLASCAILRQMGLDAVVQITTRDRNRIALQSDLLGASALGIRNVLCLSGDHVCFGNEPGAMAVFDLDSVQLLEVARKMRDQGSLCSGDPLTSPPKFFIGAVENPFADPMDFRVKRLEKKVKAGAQFIQTQCVYNIQRFREWMERVRDRGLDERVHILAGVTPLKSAKMAHYMREKVAGMDVPEELVRRVSSLPAKDQRAEGMEIALETIEALREIPGVRGIHLMAVEWEEVVPELVTRAKLTPRPSPQGEI